VVENVDMILSNCATCSRHYFESPSHEEPGLHVMNDHREQIT